MIRTGLDSLLERLDALGGRRYGLLAHAAAVSADYLPVHLALARSRGEQPVRLFAPEHGFFAVEQDMVATRNAIDAWTGTPVVSLYGDAPSSLRPDPDLFEDLDLLIIDLQDIGTRFYTYAATAAWAAEVALTAGCEVWVLDRPNPLGGDCVEGNRLEPDFESFVGAFPSPVRHGLTLAELVSWALSETSVDTTGLRSWRMESWERGMSWRATGRRWIPPSPNMPTPRIARVYPGACLLEATTISEGRGTARPFELFGSPSLDAVALADELNGRSLEGVRFSPTFFKPQFHKHAGEVCGGVQWVVTNATVMRPYRLGIEIVRALFKIDPGFGWRSEPYEFVADRPAIDLLTGCDALRRGLAGDANVDDWIDSWPVDEAAFIDATESFLLYPGQRSGSAF